MKRLLSLLLGLTVAMAAVLPAAAAAPRVVVNGNELQFDVPPVIENGRTLVPMRAIFEALGAEIYWDQETKTVSAGRGEVALAIQIGNPYANINNEAHELDVPAQIVNDRTMVPLRFVSQALGAQVGWDQATYTATITDPAAPVMPTAPEPADPAPTEPALTDPAPTDPSTPPDPAPQAHVDPESLKPIVGDWSDTIHQWLMVDAVTGLPAESDWSGKWYFFREDGTFRYAIGGCGPFICGLVVQDGYYTLEDGAIKTYSVLEDWIPRPNDPKQNPAYRDKPIAGFDYPFWFDEEGNLVIVDDMGWEDTYYRLPDE